MGLNVYFDRFVVKQIEPHIESILGCCDITTKCTVCLCLIVGYYVRLLAYCDKNEIHNLRNSIWIDVVKNKIDHLLYMNQL